MTRMCPVCGKVITVLYPDLWRYKRGDKLHRRYLCSWGCMRAYDDKKGVNEDMKLTNEQRAEVIRMLMDGESPVAYIRSCGIKNPGCTVWNLKQYLQKNEPETWAKLQAAGKRPEVPEKVPAPIGGGDWERMETPEAVPAVKVDGPLRIETPESGKVTIVPPKPKITQPLMHSGMRSTGWETDNGRYSYDRKHGCLTYENDDGDELCYTTDRWKVFLDELQTAAELMGVEL